MSTTLLLSLQITLVGMGLVFGTIVLLWGLMSLMTSLSASRKTGPGIPEKTPDRKSRAAAAAVAVALAEQAQSRIGKFPIPNTAQVSAWQLGTRSRQMYQKGSLRK